jgi:hypothetical protein
MLPLASSQIAPLILSLTQLKNEYCNRSKCMDCVGTTLLKKEDNLLLNFIGLVSVLVIDIRTNESKNPKSYKIEIFLRNMVLCVFSSADSLGMRVTSVRLFLFIYPL